jgi:hypothetical protein
MDFLPLRVQRIFDGMFQPTQQPQLNPAEMAASGNIPGPPVNPILEMMQPQTQSQEALRALLEQQPKREDYKPSLMTNIMSRLSGLSAAGPQSVSGGQPIGYRGMGIEGAKLIDDGLNKGYNQAMEGWESKLKPLHEASLNERAVNTNNRMVGAQLMQAEDRDLERTRREKADEDRKAMAEKKLEEQYAHLAYLKEKAQNPSGKIIADSEGYVLIVNPVTGETKPLFDDKGNRIKSDKLPEDMKLEIQQNNALAQIAARGGESRSTARVTGDEARKTAATRGAVEVEVSHQTVPDKQKVKQTVPGKNTAPVEGSRTSGTAPKKGDQKVFPNGKVGQWDGQGWVDTGKVAK